MYFTSFGFSPKQSKSEHRTSLKKNGTFRAKSIFLGFGAESTIFGTMISAKKILKSDGV